MINLAFQTNVQGSKMAASNFFTSQNAVSIESPEKPNNVLSDRSQKILIFGKISAHVISLNSLCRLISSSTVAIFLASPLLQSAITTNGYQYHILSPTLKKKKEYVDVAVVSSHVSYRILFSVGKRILSFHQYMSSRLISN